jgi:hypothetical protein
MDFEPDLGMLIRAIAHFFRIAATSTSGARGSYLWTNHELTTHRVITRAQSQMSMVAAQSKLIGKAGCNSVW